MPCRIPVAVSLLPCNGASYPRTLVPAHRCWVSDTLFSRSPIVPTVPRRRAARPHHTIPYLPLRWRFLPDHHSIASLKGGLLATTGPASVLRPQSTHTPCFIRTYILTTEKSVLHYAQMSWKGLDKGGVSLPSPTMPDSLPRPPPSLNVEAFPATPSVGPPPKNIKIKERTQSGRAYARMVYGIIDGGIRVLCATITPAVERAARSAPDRTLGGGVLATTGPASVLRSPPAHTPCYSV